jgi:D-cysteine desulfhydrase/L-cysteate sulfo-lyase
MINQARQTAFEDIRKRIAKVPRVALACKPTPLVEAKCLSDFLKGPRIFVKRDDLTGVAFGGNKTRNLEFRLARTVAEKADVVIVGLDLQSNSARQTVGSCNKLGLKTILVLQGRPPKEIQGNLLVDYLLGAEVHFAKDQAEQRSLMEELATRTRSHGKTPHILNDNPMFDVASALAYIECTMEIIEQLSESGAEPTYLYMSSSGKGQAGLILAKRIFRKDYEVRGVTATSEFDVPVRTAEIANRTAREMEIEVEVTPGEVVNYDDYVDQGYGIPSPAGNEAVKVFAQTEGIILDPIYTGKCAAALIDHIRSGHFDSTDSVVFVHTGGLPAIFTHNKLWQ